MSYPHVLPELETLDLAVAGRSLSRFGDGELRIATGGAAKSQCHDAKLAKELRDILKGARNDRCVVCLPRAPEQTPKGAFWTEYAKPKFTGLYDSLAPYGSAFVTRPDSAPWIDDPYYWSLVRKLWAGKDITLVVGDRKSLTSEMMSEARAVRVVHGPRVDAYAEIDRIEHEIGAPAGPVIMCLGATATVLAWRLSHKGIHALDLGHIGMFMRHAGSFNVERTSLISDNLLEANKALHAKPEGFGGDGKKHTEAVLAFAKTLDAKSILDYGCGQGTLKKALKAQGYQNFIGEYDPAIKGKDVPPKPADIVVCTDVLEHVEPDLLDNVIRHVMGLAGKGAFFCIATRLANKLLPDGRNAHLIVESVEWWTRRFCELGFPPQHVQEKRKGDGSPHDVKFWISK